MITAISGKLISRKKTEIIVENGGIGFSIFVTRKVLDTLPELNRNISVVTYLDVKENSLTLYGFFDEKEREIFKLLNTVSGISSKTAHNILSYIGFEEILNLISGKYLYSSIKIPGIGIKKLEMISMTLKDKLYKISADEEFEIKSEKSIFKADSKEQSRTDSLNALMNLGYIRADAEKMIREILKMYSDTELTTEEIIKKALSV
ncbi:MAG: Holliday junction branch migration protein RuvA [Ignavibacteria bacterium]|nr:Holliday junction branch migration protein RuvA [Ignavibacteria bacterium]